MKLIVGLGNPGVKYEKSRHNIGFMVIDKLKDKLSITSEKEKFKAFISEKNINGEKILFLKPNTFMNLSGDSIMEVVNFYKLDPKTDIVLIYDDKDLVLGKIRIREKGSSGGHNGIKSIISHLGTDFLRIKCGIGSNQDNVIDFVLGSFKKEEQEIVDQMIEKVCECTLHIIEGVKLETIMQKYNTK